MKNRKSTSIFIIAILMGVSLFGQVDEIATFVRQSSVRAHLEYLASDALKGRETGTQGIEAAAAYLASQLRSYDVDTFSGMGNYRQTIPFVKTTPPAHSSMILGDLEFNLPGDFIVMNGDQRKMRTQAVYVGHGSEEDFKNQDIRLKVAVSLCGDGTGQNVSDWFRLSAEKRKRAIAAGAAGLIEIYKNSNVPWQLIKNMGSRERLMVSDASLSGHSMPHIWLGAPQDMNLSDIAANGLTVSLDLEALEKVDARSSNVVGWVPGTDPNLRNEYIVFSAHYDHVGVGRPDETGDTIYNGARDNAVGTTAVLMLAEYLSMHPAKRSAIFVFFTAEEKGLLGSNYFVENAPVSLESIKYCFNIDNGGYNDTSIISVVGLTRTTAENEIQAACNAYGLTAIEDSAKEQGLFDRSDNVNFARKGIPAPTFSLGFRSFDEEIFKYYHQPGDEVESLDLNYIEKYIQAYVLSAVYLSSREKAAFWNQGDKYYESGLDLYKLR